jgi:primosomal protein N' (replication factor Y) (superfamily II helicase)
MASIARVEPLTTARALRGPFDYRIPRDMERVEVGTMLVVPFGRRRMLGVVVEVASKSELPLERLVEPISALEQGVPAELVRLGLWIAEDCCSTPARGLALVLPPGTGTARGSAPAARTRELLVASLTGAGSRALGDGAAVRLSRRQRLVLETLHSGPATVAELAASAEADHSALRRLEARGLIELKRRSIRRELAAAELGSTASIEVRAVERRTLTPSQQSALDSLLPTLRAGRHEQFLLHGVTGSGKTEVYLRAAAAALEQGRSAIVLVPEIALTPQTARRFREWFGDRVAVLHSRLGLGERYDEWQRLRKGQASVCVGPRSAVFAPVRDPGLIVIDEEHDAAYKHEGDPRYDARRVAERRAQLAGAVLLCGSATPRSESWLRTRRLELPARVDSQRLPPVELIDMRDTDRALHRRTREALDEVKREGAKAIVLVNRRGWSPFLDCRACGRAWICPHCDVSLTFHREEGRQQLLCHHCAHREPVPGVCPDCSSTAVARHGTGTQRLEAELQSALAPMPIFRLDTDAARRKGGIAELLHRFEQSESGVLVGTQMVAQGHDFPEVSLAVVQDADATLRFPDFRSEERTFSLVAQLAGRSGRSERGGRVFVQTLLPESACLQHAARHDAGSFIGEELRRREALAYPPYAELVEVTTSAGTQPAADEALLRVKQAVGTDDSRMQVLGPAPLFRLKDRYRSRLLIKARERATAVSAVREALARVVAERNASSGVKFSVDVDPQ